ncbi:MAG: hypothetical protein Faunusvirus2_4 [Faunusvirus sp.]|jgi:ankyrin repeat protein|uniref:Uncharacterized protein n=1 Tax=Faunusvirus sp. TaxID=2487766 RepID=A0A3G4ZVY4_9VIRU|nr:MAG: hypothetical protein Faunusvirus2_4 [Faunusvirus sp.]
MGTQYKEIFEEFIILARSGHDNKCVDYINKHNIYLHKHINKYWSPLLLAIHYRLEQTILTLIRKGVDINESGIDGLTPLILACIMHMEFAVVELIKYGAKLETYAAGTSNTALGYAITRNNKIAKLLIDAGAQYTDINMHDDTIVAYIRDRYKMTMKNIINTDKSTDNALSSSFKTTYVPGIVDIVGEYII